MKLLNKTSAWLGDFTRNLFYETLPLLCLGFLWTIAWANALVSRVQRELGPLERPLTPTHTAASGQETQLTCTDRE